MIESLGKNRCSNLSRGPWGTKRARVKRSVKETMKGTEYNRKYSLVDRGSVIGPHVDARYVSARYVPIYFIDERNRRFRPGRFSRLLLRSIRFLSFTNGPSGSGPFFGREKKNKIKRKKRASGRDLWFGVSLVGCLSAFPDRGLRECRVSSLSLISKARPRADTRSFQYNRACAHT